MTFRTRQAPSPTGYLHLGTARTVLYTKLMAITKGGQWYIRLDDTDQNRLNLEAVTPLLESLQSLGLEAAEGITLDLSDTYSQEYNIYQKGDYGPYIQSERLSIYHEHAQKMIDSKLCYWSYLTPEDRQEIQANKQITKQPINWYLESLSRTNQELLQTSVALALNDPRKPVLRYRLQRDNKLKCHDELLGDTEFDLNLLEDPTFLKSDGFPSYHLAHLIDDHLTKVSMIIRSQEWYPSFPLHTQAFIDYWGVQNLPKFLHLPFVLGATGNKKMSKRDGNVNIQDYLDQGFLPEAIVNYLAFLGWNPGGEKELFLDQADF
ncbi:MAG: hypothetical protein H7230_02830 [Candidatus Parcubacteria bacterium]|nr:hypothetical protein [Candidatus Paceibacterota bacterium]